MLVDIGTNATFKYILIHPGANDATSSDKFLRLVAPLEVQICCRRRLCPAQICPSLTFSHKQMRSLVQNLARQISQVRAIQQQPPAGGQLISTWEAGRRPQVAPKPITWFPVSGFWRHSWNTSNCGLARCIQCDSPEQRKKEIKEAAKRWTKKRNGKK